MEREGFDISGHVFLKSLWKIDALPVMKSFDCLDEIIVISRNASWYNYQIVQINAIFSNFFL